MNGAATYARVQRLLALANGIATLGPDGKVPTAQLPALTLKRVTHAIGATGVALSAAGGSLVETHCRYPFRLPAAPTRWRVRIRNRSPIYKLDGVGTHALSGIYLGEPSITGSARWAGAFKAAPTQIVGSGVLSVDATTDLTTAWFTTPLPARTLLALAIGYVGDNTTRLNYSQSGGVYWSGTGRAAEASQQTPASGAPNGTADLFDVRLEYEITDTRGVVLCIGDSITEGYSGGDGGCYPHESWPGKASLNNDFHVINAGNYSLLLSDWAASPATEWRTQRFDLATTVPDRAVISLGSNDANSSRALASMQADFETILNYVRTTVGIPEVWAGTIIPRNFTGGAETSRTAFNAWLRGVPLGLAGVIDFDDQVRLPATPATMPTDLITTYPHPLRAGYQRMADAIRFP